MANYRGAIKVLKLSLHGRLVGYLVGFQDGRNVLHFAESFKNDTQRPTLSLITHPAFPRATQLMAKPWARRQRLHPVLSNLLPEGALREFIAQRLKAHVDNEFQLLSFLGNDLPGALVAEPMAPEAVPADILQTYGDAHAVTIEMPPTGNKFSLAGVQMKFSMKAKDGRYTLADSGSLGNWIIKTPSTQHPQVPANEYMAMQLAKLVGIEVPDTQLVPLSQLDELPPLNLPDEALAFAIKRFDRNDNTRIHTEDFAQVLAKYAHDKYRSASYEHIGRIIYQYSGDGLADAQKFARRLLVNIMLANGDAHLKNWSLIYADKKTPRLAPAYDIVTTIAYIDGEREYALNLGNTKNWHRVSMAHFQYWAQHVGTPWQAIKPHLDDVATKARTLWPEALQHLPMSEPHKKKLTAHWRELHEDFRVT